MFLALREIRYNKARYTLIGAIIFLIAYVGSAALYCPDYL